MRAKREGDNVREQLALNGEGKRQDEQSEDAHLHHENDEHLCPLAAPPARAAKGTNKSVVERHLCYSNCSIFDVLVCRKLSSELNSGTNFRVPSRKKEASRINQARVTVQTFGNDKKEALLGVKKACGTTARNWEVRWRKGREGKGQLGPFVVGVDVLSGKGTSSAWKTSHSSGEEWRDKRARVGQRHHCCNSSLSEPHTSLHCRKWGVTCPVHASETNNTAGACLDCDVILGVSSDIPTRCARDITGRPR